MLKKKKQTKNKLTITYLQQIECGPHVLLVSTCNCYQHRSLNVVLYSKYAKIQQRKISIRKIHITTQLNVYKRKKSANNYPYVLPLPKPSIGDVERETEMGIAMMVMMMMKKMTKCCSNSDDGYAYGHGGDGYEMHDDDVDDYGENGTVNRMNRKI